MKKAVAVFLIIFGVLFTVAEGHSAFKIKLGIGSPQFRAIGGVSMGAYGAMNIGLGHPDFFNTIASLEDLSIWLTSSNLLKSIR